MQGRVQAFVTEELGVISMDMSKPELIEMLQMRGIKYRETPRTVTLKNRDRTNMMYIIFDDSLSRIILVDLCCTELESMVIDGATYSPDYIREKLNWKHTMKCSYIGKKVQLDTDMNAICNTGLQCRMCNSAGYIIHEAFLSESIITYIDFGEATSNEMFCIENNYGKSVNFRKIRKEDVQAMKNAMKY